MSWDEVRTRLQQEGRKRWDLVGFRTAPASGGTRLPLPASSRFRFFFGSGDLAGREELLRRYLPGEVSRIISEANDICQHRFSLLGYENLDYGSEIDWHLDAVHGKRAPLKPWFKINFLDFETLGDHKVTWELNRNQHLVTLAKAWRLTREVRYADEIHAQWYSWQKSNPYPLGCNWASTLEVAFRSLSWLWVRELMAGDLRLPAKFWNDLQEALHRNGWYIERYLSTYFSPNTHLLGEAVALLFIGLLCPEMREAARWQHKGWNIVLAEAERQVRPDGVYFEQALYYHVYALDFFLYARILAGINGHDVPTQFDAVIERMLTFLKALAESRCFQGFGDDDGGRVFNPRRNRAQHMGDPIALGAVLYDDADSARLSELTEEAIWIFGDKAVARLSSTPARPVLRSHSFKNGGVYIMGDQSPWPQQMVIDGGPQGIGHSGHGHADALSIRLAVNGHPILIDPGTCVYMSNNDDRNLFRGTRAHNTLVVDELDQAVPVSPFAWDTIPTVNTEAWIKGETFDFFAGSHNGYARLADPVVHRRFIFHAKNGCWLIRDLAEGKHMHSLQTYWHFGKDVELGQHGHALTLKLSSGSKRPESQPPTLTMFFPQNSAWKPEIFSTYDSPAYGMKLPSPGFRVQANMELPSETAIFLMPLGESELLGSFSEHFEGPMSVYRYERAENMICFIFSNQPGVWTWKSWRSDARALYCETRRGRPRHIIMLSGSFAKWQENAIVSNADVMDRWEYLNERTYSSDPAAVCHLEPMSMPVHPMA